MAIKTMAKDVGVGQYNAGWHELTISHAVDSEWNGKRVIDLNFEGYPETMRHRVFETVNKKTEEEFAIANLFRHACAGILNVLNDPTGKKPVIQYDDEVANLVGTRVNAYFFKETSTTDGNEYSRIFDLIPVVQETEHLTWTADTVERLKRNVEKRHTKKTTANSGDLGTVSVETTTNSTADIPF